MDGRGRRGVQLAGFGVVGAVAGELAYIVLIAMVLIAFMTTIQGSFEGAETPAIPGGIDGA